MDAVTSIGAYGLLAEGLSEPIAFPSKKAAEVATAYWRDSLHVDVVLFADLASGARVDTRSVDARLGFDVGLTKSVAVREGEPLGETSTRLTQEDATSVLESVARSGLDLLQEALSKAGVPASDLERLPLAVELDEGVLQALPAG